MNLFECFIIIFVLASLFYGFFRSVKFQGHWRAYRIWRLKHLWKQNCKLKVFSDKRGQRWAKKLNNWKAFD